MISLGLHSSPPSPRTSPSKKSPASRQRLATLAAGAIVVAVASATVWAISTDGNASQTTVSAGLAGARSPAIVPADSASPQQATAGNATATADEITAPSATPSAGPAATPTATPGENRPSPAKSASGDAGATMPAGTPKTGKSRTPDVAAKPKVHVISAGNCGASFYDEPQMTASGERFNPQAMTAAHKTLPLGSKVRVTNPATGESVTVRINDRGPYVGGRCLDLSKAAFSAIGSTGAGVMQVKYEVLGT
ncbi:septal ring lytic transglycosylase RlpA family protein [Streptosporangium sp. NPDC087985]|uniref:septal ring lytic transglycosylase RlpA family protein n=1 Tax=Streptosporangium sp. NPDC087985 TaxID=3366196 RepID=UPI00382E410D